MNSGRDPVKRNIVLENVQLQILGAGSAVPTKKFSHPSQVLSLREKVFMIDCGEGTQHQVRRFGVKVSRLNHIFISHLHGDHCFGLVGLLSTLDTQGRTADVYVHSHPELEELVRPMIQYFCKGLSYTIHFEPFSPTESEVIFSDRSLSVRSFPMKHSVRSSGFIFKENEKERHIKPELIKYFNVPVSQIPLIKQGADFTTEDGELIPNWQLTTDPTPAKSYAYCSDTAYTEKFLEHIEGVDCLFHEATFLQKDIASAKKTMHSTALQAATIAKMAQVKRLIIGHYSARYDDPTDLLAEAKSVFENTDYAADGKTFLF